MTDQIRNGTGLARQSWSALRANRRLLVFPLVSWIALIGKAEDAAAAFRSSDA